MVGIYKITSPSGKVYIGQSWNIHKRWREYKGLHVPQQPKILSSLQKYGADLHTFEIVCELPPDVNQQILDQYERVYWMFYHDCGFDMMNLREPSSHGRHSDESKQLMSKRRLGMKFSAEHVANMSRVRKGKIQTQETILKRQQSRLQNGTYGYIAKSTLEMATEAKKKPVVRSDTGVVYSSVKEAGAAFHCTADTIRRQIKKGIFKYI